MGVSDTGIDGPREFPATSWSALLELKDPRSPEYERNLQRLVTLYWRPVYVVVRRSWARDADQARDLTQEFFADVVLDGPILQTATQERGSFRSFLRGAIANFMRARQRHDRRVKRGGRASIINIDEQDDSAALSLAAAGTPDELFDAAWNQVVLAEAIRVVERRLDSEGKQTAFALFQRYDLDHEREALSYATLGEPFGMNTDQVKRALGHARVCLREALTEVVRGYVNGPEELAVELRRLLGGR